MKRVLTMVMMAAAVTVQAHAKTDAKALSSAVHCSVKTLDGSYGYSFSGSAPFGAFTSVGIQRFDGNGHFTSTETDAAAGQILKNIPLSGTYTVNADCTGSMVAAGPGFSVTADFVIISDGSSLYSIVTEAGTNAAGVFTKQ
jgi:hypothetical protein